MTNPFARADMFDASALVLLHVEEAGSAKVREYFARRPTVYTTDFCFYEALSVLKTKWRRVKTLSHGQYMTAASELVAWYAGVREWLPEIQLHEIQYLQHVNEIVGRTKLDYSDALQLASLKYGNFARLSRESQTVLTTADRDLASAARVEGLRVWSVLDEEAPL